MLTSRCAGGRRAPSPLWLPWSRSPSWMRNQHGCGALISAASPGPLRWTVAPAWRIAQSASPR
eukprot:1852881-Prorocentrum_lima.AAC.1